MNKLLCRSKTPNINGSRMQKFHSSLIFLFVFSFADTEDPQNLFRINIITFIYGFASIFSIAVRIIITINLLDQICPPLKITIWLNISFTLLVHFTSDLITVNPQRLALDLNRAKYLYWNRFLLPKVIFQSISLNSNRMHQQTTVDWC